MIKIDEQIIDILFKVSGIGYFDEEFGAVVGDDEFIIYRNDTGDYLAHKSEFEQEGCLIRLKEKA